jgi:hypothetical protein
MKLKNKSKITAWLEQGEIGLVLTELKKQLNALSPLPTDWLKTATSLTAQLEKLKADKLKNILSYQEETLAMNKLLDNVQEFVHQIQAEPDGGGSKPPPPPPNNASNKWWLAILPILAFGGWWLFLRQGPINPIIRICTTDFVSFTNYCDKDMERIVLSETLKGIVVTAVFEGLKDKDPLIEGELKKLNGDDFPTKNIQLTIPEGSIAYSCAIEPAYGYLWDADTYLLRLTYKGKVIGEKQFEIFALQNFTPTNTELLPFDSIRPKQEKPTLDRVSKLLEGQGH